MSVASPLLVLLLAAAVLGQEPTPQVSQDEPQEVLAYAETRAVAPGDNQPGPLLAALLPAPVQDSAVSADQPVDVVRDKRHGWGGWGGGRGGGWGGGRGGRGGYCNVCGGGGGYGGHPGGGGGYGGYPGGGGGGLGGSWSQSSSSSSSGSFGGGWGRKR